MTCKTTTVSIILIPIIDSSISSSQPSPQTLQILIQNQFRHVRLSSIPQVDEHLSLSMIFMSLHSSKDSWIPFPQTEHVDAKTNLVSSDYKLSGLYEPLFALN